MEVEQLLGSQGLWQHQVPRGLAARAAGNTVLYKGVAISTGQCAPLFLPGEPLLRQGSLQATVYRVAESDVTEATPSA